MSWDTILFLSVLGISCSVALVAMTVLMGIRYRRELPKLPIIRSIEALEEERCSLEDKLAELQDNLIDARKSIHEGEEWQTWLNEKEKEIEEKKAELQGLDKEYEKLTEIRTELEKAENRLNKINGQVHDLEQKNRILSIDNKTLGSKCDKLEKLCEERENLVAELPGLRNNAEKLHSECKRLENDLGPLRKEYTFLVSEHAKLIGTVEALRKERDLLQQAFQDLQKTYRVAGGVPKGHDPYEDLRVPYVVHRENAGGPNNEEERLTQMEHQIALAGIRMPRRILRAFHTALKVQEMSPLTVLAGISGTGKSLLPAVYARCLGMHFLNLPVQPSWNSPQDLFGFYNYLEHKYKATTLAQALLQFAQYDRLSQLSPAMDDQMLLVLLDEMNLARIEYYFSELLSRLELRRTVDTNDLQERRKVAVPLEIPRQSDDEKQKGEELRIYPGSNILFTGTMNEDESTLSLSDKVLDRAAVLRFGRPKQVRNRQPELKKIAKCAPLSFETWSSWQRTDAQDLPSEILDIIHMKLEMIMNELGVPLAHRGAQGIRQYLLLYPGQDFDRYLHALADQIEQRVLPKVRGREISSIEGPMHQLSTLLRIELQDTELAAAIDQALSDDQGVFLWSGLDRTDV